MEISHIFNGARRRVLLRSFLPDSDQKTSSKNAIAYIINCFFAKFPPSMFYEKRKISVIYLESFHLVCSVKGGERGIGDFLIVICGKTTPPPQKKKKTPPPHTNPKISVIF